MQKHDNGIVFKDNFFTQFEVIVLEDNSQRIFDTRKVKLRLYRESLVMHRNISKYYQLTFEFSTN